MSNNKPARAGLDAGSRSKSTAYRYASGRIPFESACGLPQPMRVHSPMWLSPPGFAGHGARLPRRRASSFIQVLGAIAKKPTRKAIARKYANATKAHARLRTEPGPAENPEKGGSQCRPRTTCLRDNACTSCHFRTGTDHFGQPLDLCATQGALVVQPQSKNLSPSWRAFGMKRPYYRQHWLLPSRPASLCPYQ